MCSRTTAYVEYGNALKSAQRPSNTLKRTMSVLARSVSRTTHAKQTFAQREPPCHQRYNANIHRRVERHMVRK